MSAKSSSKHPILGRYNYCVSLGNVSVDKALDGCGFMICMEMFLNRAFAFQNALAVCWETGRT